MNDTACATAAGTVERTLVAALSRLCAAWPQTRRLTVGFSGGLDSTVLLHVLAHLRPAGLQLDALHVDHGWRPESADWARHCIARATALGVGCRVLRIEARAAPGESPEAAARTARYAALGARLDAGNALLTAQHADDQAETVLLMLLRGAGPKGLAAMPEDAALGSGRLWRPLLGVSRAALQAYATHYRLDWLDDPANTDTDYDRVFLRERLMPVLAGRFPAAARTLARSARLSAEAQAAVETLAAQDLDGLTGGGAGPAGAGGTLAVAGLQALSPARARAALRLWIERLGLPLPPAARLDTVLRDLLPARRDAEPCVCWPGAEMHRFRERLHVFAPLPALPDALCLDWPPEGGEISIAGLGTLVWQPASGAGLDAARLAGRRVTLRLRQGGERFRPAGRRHAQELKKLLQAAGIAPWLRARLPLLYIDEELVAVAGLGIAEGWLAGPDAPGRVPAWQTQAPSSTMPRFVAAPLGAREAGLEHFP